MVKEKQIQIPMSTFDDLLRYFFFEDYQLAEPIKKALGDKLDAAVRHEIYTKYKTAPTEDERETARQEYLDRIGMRDDFRWNSPQKP